jgi:hypothetical protein
MHNPHKPMHALTTRSAIMDRARRLRTSLIGAKPPAGLAFLNDICCVIGNTNAYLSEDPRKKKEKKNNALTP